MGSPGDDEVESDGGHAVRQVAPPGRTALGWRATLDRTRALAGREYRLAARRRWTLGATVLFAVFSTGVVAFGASAAGPVQYDAMLATLIELGVYLVPLVALAVGYDTIVGPAETGSLQLVRSLPTPAWTIVVGKYAGRAAALGGAMLVGFAPGMALVALWVSPGAVGGYAAFVVAALLAACSFLALGVLISTVFTERTRALGAALLTWLWFVLLHDLVALGAIASLSLSGPGVSVAVLANPVDCFRVLALSQVEVVNGGFGAVMQQAGLSTPLVLAAMLAWIAVPLALAGRCMAQTR
jgi:Cu-processing system permease protein